MLILKYFSYILIQNDSLSKLFDDQDLLNLMLVILWSGFWWKRFSVAVASWTTQKLPECFTDQSADDTKANWHKETVKEGSQSPKHDKQWRKDVERFDFKVGHVECTQEKYLIVSELNKDGCCFSTHSSGSQKFLSKKASRAFLCMFRSEDSVPPPLDDFLCHRVQGW